MRHTIISIIMVFLMSGCAVSKLYGPYYGRVIDLSTREPIPGAAVLAIYYSGGLSGSEFLGATEVITDDNGKFKIPSKFLHSFTLFNVIDEPHILIYKPEYGCFPKYKKEVVVEDNAVRNIRGDPFLLGRRTVYSRNVQDFSLPSDTSLTIALDKLTREERLEYYSCYTYHVPEEKTKEMKKLEKIERINLGIDHN